MSELSKSLCVQPHILREAVMHLEQQKLLAEMRSKDRVKERNVRTDKSFDCYDWGHLVRSGDIAKLKVKELDKYLQKYNMPIVTGMVKKDKLEAVRCHFYQDKNRGNDSDSSSSDGTDSEGEDSEDNSDSDIVEQEFGSSDEESDHYVYTRSGRKATTLKTRVNKLLGDRRSSYKSSESESDSEEEPGEQETETSDEELSDTEQCVYTRSGRRTTTWKTRANMF
jgi:hypothetical protein